MTRQEVPQWCKDAAEEIEAIWTATMRPSIAAIIAKHAPSDMSKESQNIDTKSKRVDAVDTTPQPEPSGVERWENIISFAGMKSSVIGKAVNFQAGAVFVTAADHDRVVAEKDAEIERLKQDLGIADTALDVMLQQKDATIAKLRAESSARRDALVQVGEERAAVQVGEERAAEWKRAEAAEAKCAEQKRFAESMLVQAMDSQAQLAAANERVAEAYDVLCQLDNVYRRQSTGSIASFSVSKEVHLLLDRAMKILHKE